MNVINTNRIFYLSGYFNINLDPNTSSQASQSLLHMLLSNHTFSLIQKPTRVTNTSKTVIDNILTNDVKLKLPGVIKSDISDHYIIFSFSLNLTNQPLDYLPFQFRDKSNFNAESFCSQLETNLDSLNEHLINVSPENFNQLFTDFVTILKNTIEMHAP